MEAKPLWETEVGDGSTSPLVVSGRLYVVGWAAGEDHIRCLDAKTGKQVLGPSYKRPRYSRYATGDQGAYSGPTATPEYDVKTGYLHPELRRRSQLLGQQGSGRKVWGLNLYERFHVGQRPPSKVEGE